jgi:oxygen-independent coproporphyrinogen-3 oxidase
VQRALALAPAHVSLYGLTVEDHTPIARWADRGAIVEGSEEQYEEEFLYANETMSAVGFEHYEVSNFSLPGKSSRHNSAYWTGASYAGVGPSAHSFDGASRRWNVSAYSEWIRRLGVGQTVIAGEEKLTDENRVTEDVYLGLRTRRGLTVTQQEVGRVERWEAAGWAVIDEPRKDPRVRLTATGWLRLDGLATDLAAQRGRPLSAA